MSVGTPCRARSCARSVAFTVDVSVQPDDATMPLRASTATAIPSAWRSTSRWMSSRSRIAATPTTTRDPTPPAKGWAGGEAVALAKGPCAVRIARRSRDRPVPAAHRRVAHRGDHPARGLEVWRRGLQLLPDGRTEVGRGERRVERAVAPKHVARGLLADPGDA